jgi:hypothetical protein
MVSLQSVRPSYLGRQNGTVFKRCLCAGEEAVTVMYNKLSGCLVRFSLLNCVFISHTEHRRYRGGASRHVNTSHGKLELRVAFHVRGKLSLMAMIHIMLWVTRKIHRTRQLTNFDKRRRVTESIASCGTFEQC